MIVTVKDLQLGSKKGQVGGIQGGFYALMFMAVAIIIVVVVNSFGTEFVDEQRADFCTGTNVAFDDGQCYQCQALFTHNATGNDCYNATNTSQTVARTSFTTAAYNVTVAGLSAQETLSEGTEDVTDVGIITIVLGLLIALIGIFGFAGYRSMS